MVDSQQVQTDEIVGIWTFLQSVSIRTCCHSFFIVRETIFLGLKSDSAERTKPQRILEQALQTTGPKISWKQENSDWESGNI